MLEFLKSQTRKIINFLHFYFYFYFYFITDLKGVSVSRDFGYLYVYGKDEVSIHLKQKPKKIKVFFCKSYYDEQPTCSPITNYLHYKVDGKKLKIEWEVFGIKEIKWEVIY